jgi:hypothetical protein
MYFSLRVENTKNLCNSSQGKRTGERRETDISAIDTSLLSILATKKKHIADIKLVTRKMRAASHHVQMQIQLRRGIEVSHSGRKN